MLTNVKTSPPKENKNINDDAFVLIEKYIFMGAFSFGSIGFDVICYYNFSNNIAFLLSFFDLFQCILA